MTDKYFYQVENGEKGKLVHFSGNIYDCDSGESGEAYTLDEWTGLYFTIPDFIETIKNGTLIDLLCEAVSYSGHLGEREGERISREYFGSEKCKELPFSEVTEDTPCGLYCYDREIKKETV